MKVLKGIRVCAKTAFGQKTLERNVVPRLLRNRINTRSVQFVEALIFLHTGGNFMISHAFNLCNKVAYAIIVNFPSVTDLALHAVAVRYRHFAHVAAEHRDFEVF